MLYMALFFLLYLVLASTATYLFLSPKKRRQVRQGVKYVWCFGIKLPLAIVLSPYLLVLFFCMPLTFLDMFTALWPHLDILGADKSLYLRRFFMTPKTPWFRPRFLHYIARSDEGRDPHDHPGPFTTTILHGGYEEKIYFPHSAGRIRQNRNFPHQLRFALPGRTLDNPEGHTHMVELLAPTWSWVVGWNRGKPWGFWILHPTDPAQDRWVESDEYGVKGDEIKSWEVR